MFKPHNAGLTPVVVFVASLESLYSVKEQSLPCATPVVVGSAALTGAFMQKYPLAEASYLM